MRALLLNGVREENTELNQIHEILISSLREYQFHINDIPLKDRKIAPCQGCFECWVKTPGVCKINDYGRKIAEEIIQSDLVVHLTPITFGGYSSLLKTVIDRSLPNILPFFRTHKGEIHHKQRYEKRACLLVVGYQETKNEHNENTFKTLVYRNSLNMVPPIYKIVIFTKDQDLSTFQTEVEESLKEVKQYYE